MRTNFFPLLLILFLLSPATAQTTTTTVVLGVVRDSQRNVVVAASVTLIDVATNQELVTVTDAEGRYSFYALKPGKYEVKIAAPGFKTAEVHEVQAELSKVATINVSLELGEILLVQNVVAGTESQLQATDASVGVVFSAETLKRLPNATRQAETLFQLAPATTMDGEFAGARREQSTITLDGIDVSDNATGQLRTVIPVTVESIKELRSAVVNPNATFIPSSGGHIVLVTKSGTNQLHGSGYGYHQNVALTANSWTNNRVGIARPFSLDSRFGGTIGGPIKAKQSFYFFNYEGRRNPRSQTVTRIVPTASYRTGEVRMRNYLGEIVNQFKVAVNPVIKEYFDLYPLPNDFTQGDGVNTAGFTFAPSIKATSDFGVVRLDQKLGQNWNADLKLAVYRLLNPDARQVDLQKRVATAGSPQRAGNTVLALTGAFTPRLANEARFSWLQDRLNRVDAIQPQAFLGLNVAIDLAENYLDEIVDLDHTRAQSLSRSLNLYQWSDTLTWVKGGQTLQMGGNMRRIQESSQTSLKGLPTPIVMTSDLYFNCRLDGFKSSICALGGALLGKIETVSVLVTRDANLRVQPYGKGIPTRASLSEYAFFLADTWRWKQNLTLSWGLSYSWQRPPVETSGLQTLLTYKDTGQLIGYEQFIQDKLKAAQQGRSYAPDIAFVPIKQMGRDSAYETDYTNLSPRFSLAWNPNFKSGWRKRFLGQGKSIVRGGYGLVYDRTNTVQTINLPTLGVGFSQNVTHFVALSTTIDKQKPISLPDVPTVITSPIVPTDTPMITSLGTSVNRESVSFTIDPYIKVPRNHTIDFTVQRELWGGLFLEMGYIGRLARNLYINGNLNDVPYMHRDAQSRLTLAEVFNQASESWAGTAPYFFNQNGGSSPIPFDSLFRYTLTGDLRRFQRFLDERSRSQGWLRLTNLQVANLLVRASVARSNYHAGFISLRRQFSSSLAFDVNYTFSQSLDNAGPIASQGSLTQLQSSFNPDLDYGPSTFDMRHIFKANGVYQFPLRPWAQSPMLRKIVSGWYTAGIFTGQSGLPLTFLQDTNSFGGGDYASTGFVPLTRSLFDKGVHQNVFTSSEQPASGLNLFADPFYVRKNFRLARASQDGRHGRGALRGLRRWNFDWTIGKETKLSEKAKFTFSIDFLNPFNHVIFNDPDLSDSNIVNFGVLSSQYNTPRRIQLGARIDF